MGNSQGSETTITSTTSVVLNAMQETIQSTSIHAYTDAEMTIEIVGNRNIVHGIKQTVNNSVNWQEVLNVKNMASFSNSLAQKLTALTNQAQGAGSGFMDHLDSQQNLSMHQAVSNTVKQISVQRHDLISKVGGAMTINIVGNDNQVFDIQQTSMGTFGIKLANSIANSLASKNLLTASASATTKQAQTGPLQDLAQLLGALFGPIMIIIVVVVLGLGFVLLSPGGQHAVTQATDTASQVALSKTGTPAEKAAATHAANIKKGKRKVK